MKIISCINIFVSLSLTSLAHAALTKKQELTQVEAEAVAERIQGSYRIVCASLAPQNSNDQVTVPLPGNYAYPTGGDNALTAGIEFAQLPNLRTIKLTDYMTVRLTGLSDSNRTKINRPTEVFSDFYTAFQNQSDPESSGVQTVRVREMGNWYISFNVNEEWGTGPYLGMLYNAGIMGLTDKEVGPCSLSKQ